MKIQRRFTRLGTDPLDTIAWEKRESVIREPDGTVVFEMRDIEVPAFWSQVATDILAQKYFRKAGVPQPDGSLGRETSARQVVRRLAGCWTDWGRRYNYFDSDEDAAAFDAEITHMLIHQMAAPNSPQWFNTGLAYAYGITGPAQGHYFVDPDTKELTRAKDSYTHPQPHACFIQSVEDDLVNENGIMDLWVREARLFKYGSGCISERSFIPVLGRGLVRIGELYASLSKDRDVIEFDGKGRFIDVSDLNLKTLGIDRDSGAIVEDPIEKIWSYDVAKEDKLEIRFDTGARTTVSAWHPFLVWDGSKIVERRADQLLRGHAVLGPNSTARRHVDNYSKDSTLCFPTPWFRASKLQEVRTSPDLAWLAGYFLGDGNLSYRRIRISRSDKTYGYTRLRLRFFDEDREPLERVALLLRKLFGARTSIARDSRGSKCLTLTCTRANACAFFANFIHAPGEKGSTLEVPEFVRAGDVEIQSAFLAGLVDSDGTVSDRRAVYTSATRSFVSEIAAMSSLLGIGGGFVDDNSVATATIVRRSAPDRRIAAFARHLATPKHIMNLSTGERAYRRAFCMPLDPALGDKVFPERDEYGLHGFAGGQRFHTGRLSYEGLVNPHKLLAAIAARPEHEIDADLERVRLVADGVAFVTDVTACQDDVAFNDLTTSRTNTYLAGERGMVVIHNTGTNFSNLRAEGEKLAGGGSSSGLMSFLKVGDRAAGAIKSGGTTRRAAKMVILDMDHPDIEKFINWKVQEEKKVAALMAAGYDSSYEGEAYQTVSGQNSNNSVRVSDKFIDAVRNDGSWDLLWRKDRSVARTVRARDLWDQIGRAAWACADPGVQYDDIINSWHTSPKGGRIRATNPCSEYAFLDDTACNLASINLMTFFDTEKNILDVEAYRHAIRLWTITLEISVLMAQFPGKEIARKSFEYRTLGLGYANLGTMLMVAGIPYDSPRALAISGAISAILTGESYATSAEMAGELGPFARYAENADDMLRVMRNHRRAAYNAPASEYEELSVVPMGIEPAICPPYLLAAARESWDKALELGEKNGYRNAQATCIAPTGCLVGDSLVITDRGLSRLNRLGDINGRKWQDVSFRVLTDEGEREASQFFVNGVEPTRKITTASGYTIQGTPTHRVKVVNPAMGTMEWKRMADVRPDDIVALSMGRLVGEPIPVKLPPLGEDHWTTDYSTKVPREMSPELAEVVGYFMGDGSLHAKGLRFCVADTDPDVLDYLCKRFQDLFNVRAQVTQKKGYVELAVHSVELTLWWEACGFAKLSPSADHSGKGYTPRIPDSVLASNDPAVYGAFLRGLFEADGTITAGVPTWSTASSTFADEVKVMLLALGMPTTSRKTTSGWGKAPINVVRLRNQFYVARFEAAVGMMSGRKTALLRKSSVEQGARRDNVFLPAAVVRELVPSGSPMESAVAQASRRHAGALTRRSALALFEETADPRLGAALDFYYDTIASNVDGGEQLTYDLSVPSNVTYIANGFISHNTIGLLMDCDTTGIEPDFALVKFKKLAGGGYFKIINQSIPVALRNFGYTQAQIDDIVRYAKGAGTLYGSPYINAETLRARGFTDDDIAAIERTLPTVFEIAFGFNQWSLGEATLQRLGFNADQYKAADFDLLRSLGFTREEIDAANNYICGTMTIEGAPHLKEEHYSAFDCANKCGKIGRRFIQHMGHVRMMAAAQPFISGAISKTINMPNEATVQDIQEAYLRSWDLGLKAIALYRDGSKLSQPLSTKGSDKTSETAEDRQIALSKEFEERIAAARLSAADELRPDEILAAAQRILANTDNTDFKRKVAQVLERNRLPAKRRGWTQKAKIAGHTVFLRTGEYGDGTLGEIFVDLHKEGASFRSLMNCFAIAVSIGLQYGVPLEDLVEKFTFTRFEPNGFVDHPNVKSCTSVIDYIFRVLGMEYLGRTDFVQVKPEDKDVDETHHDDRALSEFETMVAEQQAAEDLPPSTAPKRPPTATRSVGTQPTVANMDPTVAARMNALRSREAQLASMMGDAPVCDGCGSLTRRNGACYVCDSCGRSMGCS